MPNCSPVLDEVFHALANSTRRQVVERLGKGPAAVTELAQPYDMALPSFLQHLRVLEKSGLVKSDKSGRTRVYALQTPRLTEAERWMADHRAVWESRLDRLDAFLTSDAENQEKTK